MPRTFSATELAVGIGVSALVGLGVGYAVGKSAHNKQLDSDITLTETAAGRCEPSYPRTISGYHGDHVTWSISNNCKSGYFVRFANFRRRNGGGLGSPEPIVNPDSPERQIPVGGPFKIEANVRDDAQGTNIYKYYIQMKANQGDQYEMRLDPDFEIWP